MPFREFLPVYISKQSLKGEYLPLPVPPLTQIKGMQSDVWPTEFDFFQLYRFANCHCWAMGAQLNRQEGQLNLGSDLQVLLSLLKFWKHINPRLKCVQPECEKLGEDQTLTTVMEK